MAAAGATAPASQPSPSRPRHSPTPVVAQRSAPAQVGPLHQQLGHQVIDAGIGGLLLLDLPDQRLCLGGPVHHEQGPGQRYPRIDEGGAAVVQGALESVRRRRRVVSQQPLLTGPQVGLGPGELLGLRAGGGQIDHLLGSRPVITGARGVELDGIEEVAIQQHHVTGRTQPGTGSNAANELSHADTALSARAFQGVPEAAPQRVPGLVMQERIDGQRRVLQQPCFQV